MSLGQGEIEGGESSALVTGVKRRKTRRPVRHTDFIDLPSTTLSLSSKREKKGPIASRPLAMEILDDALQYEILDMQDEFTLSA